MRNTVAQPASSQRLLGRVEGCSRIRAGTWTFTRALAMTGFFLRGGIGNPFLIPVAFGLLADRRRQLSAAMMQSAWGSRPKG